MQVFEKNIMDEGLSYQSWPKSDCKIFFGVRWGLWRYMVHVYAVVY